MAKDHTVPISGIIRDKDTAAYVSQEDKVMFAKDTNVNLKDLDSAASISKGDKTVSDWLNSKRNGQKPEERFNINRKADKIIATVNSYKEQHNDLESQLIQYKKEKQRNTIGFRICWITTSVAVLTMIVLILLIVFKVI